ncbi:MAG: Transcriptional regulator, AcrR family, partial [uncultured Gemmatimonadetes bacterium]
GNEGTAGPRAAGDAREDSRRGARDVRHARHRGDHHARHRRSRGVHGGRHLPPLQGQGRAHHRDGARRLPCAGAAVRPLCDGEGPGGASAADRAGVRGVRHRKAAPLRRDVHDPHSLQRAGLRPRQPGAGRLRTAAAHGDGRHRAGALSPGAERRGAACADDVGLGARAGFAADRQVRRPVDPLARPAGDLGAVHRRDDPRSFARGM